MQYHHDALLGGKVKVKCPRCGFKGEPVDNKCLICEAPLEENTSLIIKFHSIGSAQKAVIIIGAILCTSLIIPLFVRLIDGGHIYKKEQQESKPTRYSLPIDGFMGVKWGDFMQIAKEKLLSNGYMLSATTSWTTFRARTS
jgi:hypothetical protein